MAKYVANPVEVEAFRIDAVHVFVASEREERVANLLLLLENGEVVTATHEMMSRLTPVIGDYWVIQSDGYIYLNPKDVFERKYRRVDAD